MSAERFASAERAFGLLAGCAARRERISYADFAFELGLGSPRQLGWLLTPLLDWCRANDLPPLPIIVVRRADGLPSGGYDADTIAQETERVFACEWSQVAPPTPSGLARFALPRPAPRGIRLAAVAAVLLALVASVAPAAADVQKQQIGRWVLKWGEGGTGPYCTVELVEDGRTIGYQAIRSGEAYFGLRDPAWSFQSKSVRKVRLSAGAAEWKGPAIVVLPDTLVMPIDRGRGPDPKKALAATEAAHVGVDGRSTRFDLSGFPEAAEAQRACLANPA